MEWYFYALIALVAVCMIGGFIYTAKRNQKIKANGIETDAVISRIKEIESEDSEGRRETHYEYFVKYVNQNGQTVEAKLSNPPRFPREGQQLRIKYLPEKPKIALAV